MKYRIQSSRNERVASCRNDPTSSYLRASSCLARMALTERREERETREKGAKKERERECRRAEREEGPSQPPQFVRWLKRFSLNTTQEANLKKFWLR